VKKLIIDFGNTVQKLAVFDDNEIKNIFSFTNVNAQDISKVIQENGPFDASIISSVIPVKDEIADVLSLLTNFMILDHNTNIPFTNQYKTPTTLGNDRIAGIAGATKYFEGKDILVIDAGTAITFDIVNAQKEYLGGAISPGISLRFKALHKFTGKLPLISRKSPEGLIGSSTEGSILSGVMIGVLSEVEGIIEKYRQRFPDLTVAMTGGDAVYFVNNLKSNIFAIPNLVLEGLNVILEWNV
jgi:type III pantothenate kinase